MRMPAHLYNEMRDRIKAKNVNIAEYRNHLLTIQHQIKDIEKRVRWDLMWMSIDSRWVCDNIYSLGMHDSHIDTALRKIVGELEGV